MIDIHSHIIWDTDDGPATFEESVEMLREAAAAGTTDIVATPHASLHFDFDDYPQCQAAGAIALCFAADASLRRVRAATDI